jgi:hypothetical protein
LHAQGYDRIRKQYPEAAKVNDEAEAEVVVWFLGIELESQQEQNDRDLSSVIHISDPKKGRAITRRLC